MKPHYIFDLDETLLNTWRLRPFRQTRPGRNFVANNSSHLDVVGRCSEFDPFLKQIVNSLAKRDVVTVVTDSPTNYGKALLKQFGFFDMLLIGDAKKPFTDISSYVPEDADVLVIGDNGKDILFAHELKMPSVGAAWSRRVNPGKLRSAEPNRVIQNPGDLEDIIVDFEEGHIEYRPRIVPDTYNMWETVNDVNVELVSLGDYIPGNFENERNGKILDFKDGKDFTKDEILAGITNGYVSNIYNSSPNVRKGRSIRFVLEEFLKEAIKKLKKLKLKGEVLLVPATNSLPTYCYQTDMNWSFTKNLARLMNQRGYGNYVNDDRFLHRIYPKRKCVYGGDRTVRDHLETIGVLESGVGYHAKNIIIFDDVMTTGSQIKAIAGILKAEGYSGKIYGLVLGKTI